MSKCDMPSADSPERDDSGCALTFEMWPLFHATKRSGAQKPFQAHMQACPDCQALYREEFALADVVAGIALPDTPTGVELRVKRRIRRSRLIQRCTAVAAAAVLLGVGAITWQAGRNREAPAVASAQQDRSGLPAVIEAGSIEDQFDELFESDHLLLPPVVELRVLAAQREATLASINELAIKGVVQ